MDTRGASCTTTCRPPLAGRPLEAVSHGQPPAPRKQIDERGAGVRPAEGILVINLDDRLDRWQSLLREAGRHIDETRLERLSAIRGTNLPDYGRPPLFRGRRRIGPGPGAQAALSHREAIALAARRAGAACSSSRTTSPSPRFRRPGHQAPSALRELRWDICYLGFTDPIGPFRQLSALTPPSALYQLYGCNTTHAYIVRDTAYAKLLELLPTRETIWPWLTRNRAIDRWYARTLSPLHRRRSQPIHHQPGRRCVGHHRTGQRQRLSDRDSVIAYGSRPAFTIRAHPAPPALFTVRGVRCPARPDQTPAGLLMRIGLVLASYGEGGLKSMSSSWRADCFATAALEVCLVARPMCGSRLPPTSSSCRPTSPRTAVIPGPSALVPTTQESPPTDHSRAWQQGGEHDFAAPSLPAERAQCGLAQQEEERPHVRKVRARHCGQQDRGRKPQAPGHSPHPQQGRPGYRCGGPGLRRPADPCNASACLRSGASCR